MKDERIDDEQVIARLRAGDEQVFETLVARHYGTKMGGGGTEGR